MAKKTTSKSKAKAAPINDSLVNKSGVNDSQVDESNVNKCLEQVSSINESLLQESNVNDSCVTSNVNETPIQETGANESHVPEPGISEPGVQESSVVDPPVQKSRVNESPINGSRANDALPRKNNETTSIAKKRAQSELSLDLEPASKKSKDGQASGSLRNDGSSPTGESSSSTSSEAGTIDQHSWQGYCEIESEPAYFSVILREIGVKGVTVREVPFLDSDTLSFLPNPIYGLILLFRHRQFDVDNQEQMSPTKVWFANQMPGQNSCATLAMIHALLNVPGSDDVDIGEHMQQFKDYTKDFTPFQRGEAFASWEFVKKIHNSFAKKMDILENDKYLASKVNRAAKAKYARKAKDPKTSKGRKAIGREVSPETDDSADSFEENAHHYIAFVPVDGVVWKLDGMDTNPTRTGTYDEESGESWINAVSDRIMALMAAGGDDYGIFAISQCPLVGLRKKICLVDNTLKAVEGRLDVAAADWTAFVPEEDREPPSPSWLSGIGPAQRARFPVSEDVRKEMEGEELAALLGRRAGLVGELRQLVGVYAAEEAEVAEEEENAAARRWDYGPAIQKWLEMLAENGWLEENLQHFPAQN